MKNRHTQPSDSADSITPIHPLTRAHKLVGLLSDDELLDAVAYLEGVVYGTDDQPDEGDDSSQDLDDDMENFGLLGTGEEEPRNSSTGQRPAPLGPRLRASARRRARQPIDRLRCPRHAGSR